MRWLLLSLIVALGCSSKEGDSASGSTSGSSAGGDGTEQASGDSKAGSQASGSGLGHAVPRPERRLIVEGAKTTFKADFSSETTLVQGDAVAALAEVDDKAHRYTFDKAKASSRGLKLEKGRVLLIAGRALRKIDKVEDKGGKLVVSTSYASLNQAIENGEVGAEVTLPLDKKHVTAMVMPDGREIPFEDRGEWLYASVPAATGTPVLPVAAGGPQPKLDWSLKDGTLTYKAKLVPRHDKIDLELEISRKMQPTGNLLYKAKGTIKPIKAVAKAKFEDGKTTDFEYGQDDVGGVFELSMTAAGGGKLEISKEVPALKLKWIVMVGPVPLVITTKAKIIGRVQLPAKGSSVAKATFEFTGKGGMRLVDKSVDAQIGFKKEKFKAKPFDSAGFIGENVDTQFGVAFPIVSAGFFDSFMVPNFFTGVAIGSKLYWGPVCKSGYLKVTAHYGYDFKVLGLNMATMKKKFYEKEKVADQDGCLAKHKGKN